MKIVKALIGFIFKLGAALVGLLVALTLPLVKLVKYAARIW